MKKDLTEQVKRLQDFLEEWWDNDFNIEMELENMPSKILIFGLEGSYWDNQGDGKWHFYGKRNLEPAMLNYHPQYTKFQEKLPESIWGRYFTLEEAKELVELVFGSRKTKYKEIERKFG